MEIDPSCIQMAWLMFCFGNSKHYHWMIVGHDVTRVKFPSPSLEFGQDKSWRKSWIFFVKFMELHGFHRCLIDFKAKWQAFLRRIVELQLVSDGTVDQAWSDVMTTWYMELSVLSWGYPQIIQVMDKETYGDLGIPHVKHVKNIDHLN